MNDNFKPPAQKLENPFLNGLNGIRPPYGFTPSGMLRPKELQPPPMYGPRGSTIPPKFLPKYVKNFKTYNNNSNWNTNRNKDNKQNFNNQTDGNAENKKFYCETCERDFQSRFKFEEHKKDHVRCSVSGCMFKGHPQGLERHIEQQHVSGLFDKIKNLNTPEEIEKWRAERKSRFPSQRNIELRQRAQEERLKRGEKLSKNNSRFAKRSDRERNIKGNQNRKKQDSRNRNKRKDDSNFTQIEKSAETIAQSDEENDKMNGNLKRFTGTSQLSDFLTQKKTSFSGNPLTVLLGMYGSSDDEINEPEEGEVFKKDDPPLTTVENKQASEELSSCEEPEEINTEKPTKLLKDNPLLTIIQNEEESEQELSSGEEPEEIKTAKSTEELPPLAIEVVKPTNNPNPRKRKRKNPNLQKAIPPKKQKSLLDNPRLKCSNQNTMLAKLLEPEIRHERNILLQCVRYVVENNFFGIGNENKT